MRKSAHHHTVILALSISLTIFHSATQASWFGPKTVQLEGVALAEKMRAHPLVVSTSAAPLEIKSKSAAIGGFVLGFVLSSAAASGGGGIRPGQSAQQMNQAMQANTALATNFNTNFQTFVQNIAAEQALKTVSQIAQEGPAPIVINQLVPALLASNDLKVRMAQKDSPALADDLQLSIQQSEWKVDFSMASSDYTLIHNMQVQLFQKSSNTVFFNGACSDSSRKMPLEAWQKDDNAAIAKASDEIAKQCASDLLAKLQLKAVAKPAKPIESATTPIPAPTVAPVAPVTALETDKVNTTPAPVVADQTAKPESTTPSSATPESANKTTESSQEKPVAK